MSNKEHRGNSPLDPEIAINFECSRFFLPAERDAARVGIARELGDFCEKLGELIAEDSDSLTQLIHEGRSLLARLNCPIEAAEIDAVNADGQVQIEWKDIVDYYAVEGYDRICGALDQLGVSESVNWKLHDGLKHYSNEFYTSLENSDQRVRKIVDIYKIENDSGWHERLLGKAELRLYESVILNAADNFGIPTSKIRTFDIGCGSGRCIHQFQQLFKRDRPRFPSKYERGLLSGYHGVDICHANYKATRDELNKVFPQKPSGLRGWFDEMRGKTHPPDNVMLGDIFSHEYEPPQGIHCDFSMMRTALHCNTEAKARRFLELIISTLIPGNKKRPGGVATFDSVHLPIKELASEETRSNLDDLSHFYFQLILAYRRRYQKLMPEGVDLSEMSRYPIYDNTTGKGFYWREVITPKYIKYLIKKYNLDLEILDSTVKTPEAPEDLEEREEMIQLGLKWMRDNELEDYIELEIRQRFERGEINEELLTQAKKYHLAPVEYLKRDVVYRWVAEFPALFITLQRPQKK